MRQAVLVPAFATLLAGCVTAQQSELQQSLAADGHEIARNECASCHAVERAVASPNEAAPSFVGLLRRYRSDVLELELIEGVRVAHPMPAFQFNPQGVDALIAYMRSIENVEDR